MPKFVRRINPKSHRRRIKGHLCLERNDQVRLDEDVEVKIKDRTVKFLKGEILQGAISHITNRKMGTAVFTVIYRDGKRLTKKGIDVDFLLANQDVD